MIESPLLESQSTLTLQQIDPITDCRWTELVDRHPRASVFHTAGWLKALQQTYGYKPLAFIASDSQNQTSGGTVFCRVESRLTGCRLVSLPFSDHCDVLAENDSQASRLLTESLREVKSGALKYVEIRPMHSENGDLMPFGASERFCFHQLDLHPSEEQLFRSFHKTSIQQTIRRAEREKLTGDEGRSEGLLAQFYGLLLKTRRRQGLPTQPFEWFRNLLKYLGEALTIRVAMKNGQPIASILTLRHKQTIVYKYGCSDENFHNLGGMPFLFWQAIRQAKAGGASVFDFGRSDLDNAGLITFKDRWGAARSTLNYFRYPAKLTNEVGSGWKGRVAKQILMRMPDAMLELTGRLLYRHVA